MSTQDIIDQLDPEIARQMGFTSFGGAKRRKLANADDAVTDVEEKKRDQINPPAVDENGEEIISGGYNDPNLPPGLGIYGTRAVPSQSQIEEQEKQRRLQALRKGVKNERGDTVYFLPSFLEDPWKILIEERKPLNMRMGPRGIEYSRG